MDVMRLPLGILSGIGFIGAGVIIKHNYSVSGLTTAATLWLVTVLGLLFGTGNLLLGITGSFLAFLILRVLKIIERYVSHLYRGSLHLSLSSEAPGEAELQKILLAANCLIDRWAAQYDPANVLAVIDCHVKWRAKSSRVRTPAFLEQFRSVPGIRSMTLKE